jgi:hypothetical protein
MAYGLTEQEQARLDAVPWPQKLYVAEQLGAERIERERQARIAEDTRRYEETLAYAAHTRRRAQEEARKHRAGLPCNAWCCDECARLVNLA